MINAGLMWSISLSFLHLYEGAAGILPKGTYYIALKRLTPKTRREGYGDRLIHLNVTRK